MTGRGRKGRPTLACGRDTSLPMRALRRGQVLVWPLRMLLPAPPQPLALTCLLYTSDAADDM
eukprot:883449-Alexandrium_andersonii.AAC.1